MELKTYKIKKAQWSITVEKELKLPASIVLIYDPGEVGNGLYVGEDGFDHYLGAIFKSEMDYDSWKDTKQGDLVSTFSFGDVVFFKVNNIKPLSKLPVVSSKDFIDRFELDSYYVRTKEKTSYKVPGILTKTGEEDEKAYQDELRNYLAGDRENWEPVGGRVKSICKVLDVKSAFNFRVEEVTAFSLIGDREYKSMQITTTSLEDLLDNHFADVDVLKGPEAELEYRAMIQNVLKPLNYVAVPCTCLP